MTITLYLDAVIYAQHARSGVNTYFDQLIPRLPNYGVNVDVFVPSRPLAIPTCGAGVEFRRRDIIPRRTGLSYRLDQWFAKAAEQGNLRLMGLRLPGRSGVFLSTFLTTVRTKLPKLAIAHDLAQVRLSHRFPGVWTDAYKQAMHRHYVSSDHVVAVSEQTRRDAIELYGLRPDRVDVVHHGIDRDIFFPSPNRELVQSAAPDLPHAAQYFLYVGKRYPYKNWSGLLAGFAESLCRSEMFLVAAGSTFNTEERVEIMRMGLGDRVIVAENPSTNTLRALYSCAMAFVYPSVCEGFGLPLLEAMACGCPVLASDIPVFHEVAGEAATYFDPENPRAIANALCDSLDPDPRAQFIAAGNARCKEFSWEQCAENTGLILNRLAVTQIQ